MDEYGYIYATVGVMALYFLVHVARRRFDPFAPVWLFFVGYLQVYVIQALSYHDWAIGARGEELVTAANFQAFWALLWFLAVYHLGAGRFLARRLPEPPRRWPTGIVCAMAAVLFVWGLFCTSLTGAPDPDTVSKQEALLRSFPFVMMVSALLLIVTGRRIAAPRPGLLAVGLGVAGLYVLIWMFNGKRSHSLIGVLATVCAFYIARLKRPSWTVLAATSFAGALVVALAIGWRHNDNYERSFSGFAEYISEFDISKILVSMDVADDQELDTYETKEYGGFLLMLDTVPEKSEYDHGENYLRTFSTFIPRVIWPDKPLYGRKQWVNAWIAGSELERDEDFTSPAIGILGAAQLNGGVVGTLIVLGVIAIALRSLYDYFLMHRESTWAQFFWSGFFFNAWFMVVNDDPMVWYYYNWAFAVLPTVGATWFISKYFMTSGVEDGQPAAAPAAAAAPLYGPAFQTFPYAPRRA